MRNSNWFLGTLFLLLAGSEVSAQYRAVKHRKALQNEIPVSKPGSYNKEGAKYILTSNISAATSTLFLGKNTTLDLNGYTITYTDANYNHISNGGFEEDLKGWDVSKAPGARVRLTEEVHEFIGKKLLSLQAGDEVRSSYVYLPVANRSYFAMCGITGRYYHDPAMKGDLTKDMKVSVYVESEDGENITCINRYGDTILAGTPVEKKSPRLGGGFVYAHMSNLPAGKYRIRIKADTDCLIDEVDITPAMDVGISVIGNTIPLAHYDHLIRQSYPPVLPAFFDFTGDVQQGLPLPGYPQALGDGSVVIKNGTIRSASKGVLSWGIQSSAPEVKLILQNLHIETAGISSGAANLMWTTITDCRFDVDMPFLIQRHVGLCAVVLRGENASRISKSSFYGGQGCLSIRGKKSIINNNLFVNRQTVTNHYSIMGTGDSSKIYSNRFEPDQGSGIYVSRNTEVYDNLFRISTSPPICEFGREEYSVAAIRLGDYNAEPGSPKASVGNRIYNNKIYITALNYPQPREYIPMAWGIYYSARGGDNYVYRNDIFVEKTEPLSKVEAAAFYICGGPKYYGGQFYENNITTNVPAAWVASMYGGASNSQLYNNRIIHTGGAKFNTFRMGMKGCNDCVAKNVAFRSNQITGDSFSVDATDQGHVYTVAWTLSLNVTDVNKKPVSKEAVTVMDCDNNIAAHGTTNQKGVFRVELPEYTVDGNKKTAKAPYRVQVGNTIRQIILNKNMTVTVTLKSTGKTKA